MVPSVGQSLILSRGGEGLGLHLGGRTDHLPRAIPEERLEDGGVQIVVELGGGPGAEHQLGENRCLRHGDLAAVSGRWAGWLGLGATADHQRGRRRLRPLRRLGPTARPIAMISWAGWLGVLPLLGCGGSLVRGGRAAETLPMEHGAGPNRDRCHLPAQWCEVVEVPEQRSAVQLDAVADLLVTRHWAAVRHHRDHPIDVAEEGARVGHGEQGRCVDQDEVVVAPQLLEQFLSLIRASISIPLRGKSREPTRSSRPPSTRASRLAVIPAAVTTVLVSPPPSKSALNP